MNDRRQAARIAIADVLGRGIDPEVFVRSFERAAALQAMRLLGQQLEAMQMDADRDRIIDAARD